MKATEVYPSGAEGADRVSKRASLRPFTEAVKGGMSGMPDETGRVNQLGFHTYLSIRKGYRPAEEHELKSLNDLHKHSEALKDPEASADLHVGIGSPSVIANARREAEQGVAPYRLPFHTHVHLEKMPGSDTFTPAFMYTNPAHQRKGWGTTLWDHLHRKIKSAGLNMDHDWEHQTGAGHIWSRKSSGREGDHGPLDRYDLESRLDEKSEWHHLNHEQKSGFLTRATQMINRGTGEFADPEIRHSKGLVGNTEVHHLRDYMKKVHGVNLHPFSVADTLHHMTGRSGNGYGYHSGYHGTPLEKLKGRFVQERNSKMQRSNSWAPHGLTRTPLKGRVRKRGAATRRPVW